MKIGNLVAAGQAIAAGLPGCESIDDLLERHAEDKNYESAAKLGIAECILAAERGSPLRQNPSNIRLPTIDGYSQHWASRLLQTVAKGCAKGGKNLAETFTRLKVINFNYDRCFEWFTFLWLRNVYNLNEYEALEILKLLDVVHPYGSLGPIPGTSREGIPFGYEPNEHELFEISQNILTYSESLEKDHRPGLISKLTQDSDRFIFLGFAFHPQNMNLMNMGTGISGSQVYATTVGMPPPRWENAQYRIARTLSQSKKSISILSSEVSCEELIRHYGDRWAD